MSNKFLTYLKREHARLEDALQFASPSASPTLLR
jgi:hypothetical protein